MVSRLKKSISKSKENKVAVALFVITKFLPIIIISMFSYFHAFLWISGVSQGNKKVSFRTD